MISAALLHSVNGLKKNFLVYRGVPIFKFHISDMHDIIFGSFEDKLLQKCLFHSGWMYKRSSELGADDKIDARKKQGSSVVGTVQFQEISGRNGLINRLINSIAVITVEPAGQVACRRG